MRQATSQLIFGGILSHHFLTESVKGALGQPGLATENRRLKLRSHSESQAFDTLMNGS